MWRALTLTLIALALVPTTTAAQLPSPATIEHDRVRIRAHLAATEEVLRATDVSHLTDAQRAAREDRLDDLHAYWLRAEFPHGSPQQPAPLSPTFIDTGDRPCAMAYLVIASGHEDVAREIARDQNHAYVPDITHPALAAWLDANGMTVAEAARVQPSYCFSHPNPEDCECLELCQYAEDAGPPVCSAGFTYYDASAEAIWSLCAANCIDAPVTGSAVCTSISECTCTDAGVTEDASTFDAGVVPGVRSASCSATHARSSHAYAFVLMALGLAALRRRRRALSPSSSFPLPPDALRDTRRGGEVR